VLQVGFAVEEGGAALHGFIDALRAPGAMTVPIESSRDASQQLTLVQKVRQQHLTRIAASAHQ